MDSRPTYRASTTADVALLIRAMIALRLLHRAVTHRLDLVAVGIAEECAVVGGVIVAQAGWAVVDAAGGDTRAPERVHLASRFRLEAPMPAGGLVRLRALVDGDVDAVRMLNICHVLVADAAVRS